MFHRYESTDGKLGLIYGSHCRNIRSIYTVFQFHRYESSDGELGLIYGLNCRNIRSIYMVFPPV